MIVCKECGNETSVPIKGEFICLKCYDKRLKSKARIEQPPKFWRTK